ncbi:hypothetical protein GNY06_09375 [Elizabethkingia argentiflava]|uniref:Glycosyltransferase RgtA/B/C/D-like domain-containing protein n=1 Tax=Elizabethkingia argenteiflava TaxID=2681556 RepID=A0A845PTL8_9FLAO|nr:hypothetical protein [Elizabethkingia argenteiflava]
MSFGGFIAKEFRLIYDERIPWDAYFSLDNYSIVTTGGGWERHPFSKYLFDLIREVALTVSGGKKDASFRISLVFCSATAVSFSLLHLYKYLRNIISLPLWISLFLVLFFSVFTTPIILSFTPETYTYSLFLLVFFNYFSALNITQEKKMTTLPLTGFAIFIGGLTITNLAKVYIPICLENRLFQKWSNIVSAFIRCLVSIGAFFLLYLWRLDFKLHTIVEQTFSQYEKFSKPKVTPLWDMIASWFWGGNILFPSFTIRDYHSKIGFQYKALFMDVYSLWVPYLFLSVLTCLVIWSLVANYKNKLVHMLGLSLFCDIVIHCILKFGLHTAYIYGGHFIFIVPMLLGWLFYSQKTKPKILSALWCVLIILFAYLSLNNLYRLNEVVEFAKLYYR